MEGVDTIIDPKLRCHVCGEKSFGLREGFFYCDECGTKQDQVRAVEIDREDEFNDSKHLKKQKIKTIKAEKPDLTSWECYNYILRGYVEELMSMGAKEQLKQMTLQVWAAYLRRLEVAFFNKKHLELPRLGVRYLKRDASALYNHSVERRKKKRRRTEDGSVKSAESSLREWRKNKRKLDESEYSFQTASQSLFSRESLSQLSTNTSTTGNTTRAIQLKFSSLARKQFKKVMPIKHLQKHEKDSEGNLECHKQPKMRALHRFDRTVTSLNLKQIYAILAIALNLVEDDIELIDLVRFINEDRFSTTTVSHFFPENIVPHCKALLTEIGFFSQVTKFTYKAMREQTASLARFLCIKEFRKPDISRLVKRFVSELNLPDDIALLVDRLINLLPPKLETRAEFAYPAYEARAMAYIIFVLKLIFGLDGHKEQVISDSALKINLHIAEENSVENKPNLLFVWGDWVEYVEMRKIIISQYNRNFCHQFNQTQSTAQLLAELSDEQVRMQENNFLENEPEVQKFKSTDALFASMKKLFDEILQDDIETKKDTAHAISFPPSFTPASSYFKRILLYASSKEKNDSKGSIAVPEYMRTDHTQRSVRYFLQPSPLRGFFKKKDIKFEVLKEPCTSKRKFVGVFRQPLEQRVNNVVLEANFEITEEEWLEEIKRKPQNKELEFKTEFESYSKKHKRRLEKATLMKREKSLESEWKNINEKSLNTSDDIAAKDFLLPASEFSQKLDLRLAKGADDLASLHSIDVFGEDNMEPIENMSLNEPRRHFDGVYLLNDISSTEESSSDHEDEEVVMSQHLFSSKSDSTSSKTHTLSHQKDSMKLTFVRSNLDYWTLIGYIVSLNDKQKKVLERKFPRSFFWLLETCAQTIGVEWNVVYEQLLILEMMFVYGIKPLQDMKDFVEFKPSIEIKDINHLILMFREIW